MSRDSKAPRRQWGAGPGGVGGGGASAKPGTGGTGMGGGRRPVANVKSGTADATRNGSAAKLKATAATTPMPAATGAAAAAPVVADDYDDYLYMLEEKNRMKKGDERVRNPHKIQEKEQGFMLYVNGAHTKPRKGGHGGGAGGTASHISPSKAAAAAQRGTGYLSQTSADRTTRAKTAPGKRKAWNPSECSVKQVDGTSVPVTAPGMITGIYEDDFESDSVSEDSDAGDSSNSSGGDEYDDDGDDKEDQTLTLSRNEVAMLRRSLEEEDLRRAVTNALNDSDDDDDDSLDNEVAESTGSGTDDVSDQCRDDSLDSSSDSDRMRAMQRRRDDDVAGDGDVDDEDDDAVLQGACVTLTFSPRKPKTVLSAVSRRNLLSAGQADSDVVAADILAAINAENRRLEKHGTHDQANKTVPSSMEHEKTPLPNPDEEDTQTGLISEPAEQSAMQTEDEAAMERSVPSPPLRDRTPSPTTNDPPAETEQKEISEPTGEAEKQDQLEAVAPVPAQVERAKQSGIPLPRNSPRAIKAFSTDRGNPERKPDARADLPACVPESPSATGNVQTAADATRNNLTSDGGRRDSASSAPAPAPAENKVQVPASPAPPPTTSPTTSPTLPPTTPSHSEDPAAAAVATAAAIPSRQRSKWAEGMPAGHTDARRKPGSGPVKALHPDRRPPDNSSTPGDGDASHDRTTVEIATDRARDLDGRQQRKLLKMIQKLDDTLPADGEPSATSEAASSAAQNPPGRSKPAKSKGGGKKKKKVSENLWIGLKLLSNWGHESKIGLTEVEFVTTDNKRLWLGSSRVKVTQSMETSSESCDGAAALLNGKTRTHHNTFMWSTDYDPNFPVLLTFEPRCLLPSVPGDEGEGVDTSLPRLKSIRVWNYNRSGDELSMGVRQAALLVNNRQVWSGRISKGCGKSHTDYSTTIRLAGLPLLWPQPAKAPVGPAATSSETTTLPVEPLAEADTSKPRAHSAKLRAILDIPEPRKADTTPLFDDVPAAGARPMSGRRSGMHSAGSRTGSAATATARTGLVRCDSDGSLAPAARSSRQGDDLGWLSQPPAERQKTAVIQHGMSRLLLSHSISTSEPSIAIAEDTSDGERRAPSRDVPSRMRADQAPSSAPVRSSRAGSAIDPLFSDDRAFVASRAGSRAQSAGLRDRSQKSIEKVAGLDDDDSAAQSADPSSSQYPSARRPSRQGLAVPAGDLYSAESQQELTDVTTEFVDFAATPSALSLAAAATDAGNTAVVDDAEEGGDDAMHAMAPLQLPLPPDEESDVVAGMEQSLLSLRQFQDTQRGRIEEELSADGAGDVLDSFMSEMSARQREEEADTTPGRAEESEESDAHFQIPELPYGRYLELVIYTTWGDRHYVGLNGIEVFSMDGLPVRASRISGDPADINSLPGYSADPRVVSNLLDGVNHTRDDFHMWLAPFTAGKRHTVSIAFTQSTNIAMIRIWNYNKSRIHSSRGARHIALLLDGEPIFEGEIAKACGGLNGGIEAFGDTIVFTTDSDVLNMVGEHDEWFQREAAEFASLSESSSSVMGEDRPGTAAKASEMPSEDRPETRVGQQPTEEQTPRQKDASKRSKWKSGQKPCVGRVLELQFTETWGDGDFVGLTGMAVLGARGKALTLSEDQLDANPRDITVLDGYESDIRLLGNLLSDCCVTMDDGHMWLAPYEPGIANVLTVDFGAETRVTGVQFWNYNKSAEDTCRGVKTVHAFLDGQQISPNSGYLVRKAPGNCHFDFGQSISFGPAVSGSVSSMIPATGSSDDVSAAKLPAGFMFRLRVLSTWGDPFYVGLNGVELYNEHFQVMEPNLVTAFPESCNILPDVDDDCRTPDKLVNGVYDTFDGREMWLAPVLPDVINDVYLVFEVPVCVSMVKLWNYSKTPSRGVKEFSLLVDDLMVFGGVLAQSDGMATGILPTCPPPVQHQSILFTEDADVVYGEREFVISQPKADDVIRMVDEDNPRGSEQRNTNVKKPVQAHRPTTSMPSSGVARTHAQRR